MTPSERIPFSRHGIRPDLLATHTSATFFAPLRKPHSPSGITPPISQYMHFPFFPPRLACQPLSSDVHNPLLVPPDVVMRQYSALLPCEGLLRERAALLLHQHCLPGRHPHYVAVGRNGGIDYWFQSDRIDELGDGVVTVHARFSIVARLCS